MPSIHLTIMTRAMRKTAQAPCLPARRADVILAANAGLEIYEDIVAIIKSKTNQNSCSLVYGTDSDGTYVEGYAYEATTSGENCDTTAEKKTILAVVEKCANKLNAQGAIRAAAP
ncbi:hypothetical protein Aspvir_009332 [Aspergillus viridinutans]|uniref:Secreted protein CSS2 C-terminal domain-containing protein n=1 Tax=Aspergillus viridinutans TaxID=75553 RepID=A0A9P3BZA2_ASPVI|nr:uncharacterized protein Aspvir_009332 [Aspergillus viridinutans]GIK05228.1 hypothetical protein Aspvir_009332 [Aspergillus viridinutans]